MDELVFKHGTHTVRTQNVIATVHVERDVTARAFCRVARRVARKGGAA